MMICTHSNRKKDMNHTSYTEINYFARAMNTAAGALTALITDYSDIYGMYERSGQRANKIVIFATFGLHENIRSFINDHPDFPVYLVLEDPNWPVEFEIDRDYTLITPFQKLQYLTPDAMRIQLKQELNYTLSKFSTHWYVPFGLLRFTYNALLSENQQDQLDALKKEIKELKNNHSLNQVYIGSMKKDRAEHFRKMIIAGTDFYGSFEKNELLEMTGLEDMHDSRIMGRIDEQLVTRIYGLYDRAVFAPDDKMVKLNSCYARLAEMCIAQSEFYIYANKELKDEVWKQVKLISDYHKRWRTYQIVEGKMQLAFLPKSYSSISEYIYDLFYEYVHD